MTLILAIPIERVGFESSVVILLATEGMNSFPREEKKKYVSDIDVSAHFRLLKALLM